MRTFAQVIRCAVTATVASCVRTLNLASTDHISSEYAHCWFYRFHVLLHKYVLNKKFHTPSMNSIKIPHHEFPLCESHEDKEKTLYSFNKCCHCHLVGCNMCIWLLQMVQLACQLLYYLQLNHESWDSPNLGNVPPSKGIHHYKVLIISTRSNPL